EARFGTEEVDVALQEEQLGTAHAVAQAAPMLKDATGAIIIVYGDIPLLRRETLERLRGVWPAGGVALVTAPLPDPTGYGRILRTKEGGVARIVEEKDASAAEKRIAEINAGIYCVDAALLREAIARVGNKNAQREFYLTDLAEIAAARGRVESIEQAADDGSGTNDRAHVDSTA